MGVALDLYLMRIILVQCARKMGQRWRIGRVKTTISVDCRGEYDGKDL